MTPVSVAVVEHADGNVASRPRNLFADREFLASLIGQTLATIDALVARPGLVHGDAEQVALFFFILLYTAALACKAHGQCQHAPAPTLCKPPRRPAAS